MFTGLIQDIGRLGRLERRGREASLTVATAFKDLVVGESVAVMGACLSVTRFVAGEMTAFASAETLEKTGLGALGAGAAVNLERALRAGDPFGGHIVTGHVDDRVRLLARERIGEAERFTLLLPDGALSKQIAEKGSIALDGVSLTVNAVGDDSFEVMVIPLSLSHTTLHLLRVGDKMNVETDVLAKYIARQLLGPSETRGIDMALLERAGFVR